MSYICFLHYWNHCHAQKSKIPSYIHICKRNDPNVEDCIINSIEKIRGKLRVGIPELEVPGLEPLVIPELVIQRGTRFTATGTNIVVRGASNFKITKLKVDIPNNIFRFGIKIPALRINSKYSVNAKILSVPIKGQGDVTANATDCIGDVILKAKRVQRDGGIYLEFTDIDLNLRIDNYAIRFENLFDGNKELGDAVNSSLNQNKQEFMQALKPYVEEVIESIFLDIANKITKNFTLDELFPEK